VEIDIRPMFYDMFRSVDFAPWNTGLNPDNKMLADSIHQSVTVAKESRL